jgi:hypothetical protein
LHVPPSVPNPVGDCSAHEGNKKAKPSFAPIHAHLRRFRPKRLLNIDLPAFADEVRSESSTFYKIAYAGRKTCTDTIISSFSRHYKKIENQ